MENLAQKQFSWHACIAEQHLETAYQKEQLQSSRPFILTAIGILLFIELLGFFVDYWAHTGAMVDNTILAARIFAIILGLGCGLYIYQHPRTYNLARHIYLVGIMSVFLWTLINYDPTDYLLPISLIGTALILYLALPMPWLSRVAYSLGFTIAGVTMWSSVHPIDEHFFRIIVWLVFSQLTGASAAYFDNLNKRKLFLQDLQLKQQLESEKQLLIRNDSLMGLISHELRTPLTTINIQADILKRRGDNNKIANTIASNSRALLQILESWLLTNRDIDFEVKTLIQHPEEVLNIAIEDFRHHLPNVNIEQKKLRNIPSVTFDERVLLLTFKSLLTNAYQHGHSDKGIKVSFYKTSNNLHFTIRDWGRGMDKEQLTTLFARRASIPKSTSNLGVGLHLLYNLIKASGGAIKAYSSINTGTLIVISLPFKL